MEERRSIFFQVQILFVTILLFSFWGCNKEEKNSNEMNFEINPALIEAPYLDSAHSFKLSPPKGWLPLDTNYLSKISAVLMAKETNEGNNLRFQPLKIWADSTQGVFLIASRFLSPPDNSDSIISRIKSSIIEKTKAMNTKSATFIHKSTTLTQFLIQISQPVPYVNFRLLIHNPSKTRISSIVQIDYFIPKLNYSEKTAKSIESSIGSLSFFN
jgi:hypothetical protein